MRIRLAADRARWLGDRLGIAESVFFLAQLARLRGDLDEAQALLGECRALAVALGVTKLPPTFGRSLAAWALGLAVAPLIASKNT